jgi:threonylcarbamoyladenosine tRNA methylthiotransferase MtaB
VDFTAVRLAADEAPGTFHSIAIAGHDGARLIGA